MIVRKLRNAYFASRLHDRRLRRLKPAGMQAVATDPRPGDPAKGADVITGRFELAARSLDLGPDPWDAAVQSDRAFDDLQSFAWLRDLAALSSADARDRAAGLAHGWLRRWDRWAVAAWTPGIIGRRLLAWTNHLDFMTAASDTPGPLNDLAASFAAQAQHLAGFAGDGWIDGQADDGDFAAATALIVAGTAVPGLADLSATGIDRLASATTRLPADGGHPSGSPEIMANILLRLIEARKVLRQGLAPPPAFLDPAIQRQVAALRTVIHGDGGLALFNGGSAGRAIDQSAILRASGARAMAAESLPDTGFERLSAEKTQIIADAGTRSSGRLSFEMSAGRHRLVVNCGAHPDETTEWARVLRSTAAHSTLTVNDRDAMRRRPGNENTGIGTLRTERQGSQLAQLSHDGYRDAFGVIHNRDLYLSPAGDDFRGKDVLLGGPAAFTIRFHLHPDGAASILQGGDAVLIRLPGGQGWRFRSAGADVQLEESAYLGRPERPRRCQQIVLRGEARGPETLIRWSFLREGR